MAGRNGPAHHRERYDYRLVAEAVLGDLDTQLTAGYLARIRDAAPRVFGQLSDEEALLRSRALGLEEETARPTLGGLMALGVYPQQFFPRLGISLAVFAAADRQAPEEGCEHPVNLKSIVGPIPVMVSEALAEIRSACLADMRDYPDDAVREALVNALVHRDYSPAGCGFAVQVNLYPDRLEIINPGGLCDGVSIEQLGRFGVSATRNEHLAAILESTPYAAEDIESGYVTENKGTGYGKILQALAQADMPPPVVRDDGSSFCLTLYKRGLRLDCEMARVAAAPPAREAAAAAALDFSEEAAYGRPPIRGGRVESGTMAVELDNDQRWIIEWLSIKGASKASAIAEGLGASRATTVRKLNALCEKGLVRRNGRARSPELTYSLTG